MNSGEKKDASGNSPVANRTLAKRISDILPLSIAKWFNRLQPFPNQSHPEQKRRRLSEDPNHYLPTTTCSSTNTDSIYSSTSTKKRKNENLLSATADISLEDEVKSSLHSDDYMNPNETFVDHNRTSVISPNTELEKDRMFHHGRPSVDINGSSGSTFYPGETMYGGKSNSFSKALIKRRNRGGIDRKMSGATERIKELLKTYSSPLEDVRRISQFVTDENNSNSSTNISEVSSQKISNKTQELQLPSIAKILSIKKKSVPMDSTSSARQLLASQSSATKYSPYKRLVSPRKRHDMKRRASMSSMSSMPVNKGCLPYFSFIESASKYEKNSEVWQSENKPFKESIPAETMDAESNNTESDNCTALDTSDATCISDDAVSINGLSKEISTNSSGCEKESSTESPIVPKSTNWKCEICWVKNDMSTSICVCCGGKMPQNKMDKNETSGPAETNKNAVSLSINNDPSLINKITNVKSQEEKWECNVCLLKIDKQNSKCVSCDATKQSDNKILSTKEVTKSQEETWKCNVCLVRNDNNKSKCICCESEKPGSKVSDIKFNFLPDKKTSFKFGINYNDTKQEFSKNIVQEVTENNDVPLKQFSYGVPPIKPVVQVFLSTIEEESHPSSSSSEQTTTSELAEKETVIDRRQVLFETDSIQSRSPLPLDSTFELNSNPRQQHSANSSIDLANAGQEKTTANVSTPQTPQNLYERSIPSHGSSEPKMHNEQTVAESSRQPSTLSLQENHLSETYPSPPSTKYTLGSSSHQNSFNISSTKKVNFKFGNCKTDSSNFGVFSGKFESPKIDSQNMTSAVNASNTINMSTNSSNSVLHSNKVPEYLNRDNSMSVINQAPPSNSLPTGAVFGAPTQQRENFWPPTNSYSTPQNPTQPTYQNNQAPPPFTFGAMPYATQNPYNVPTFPNNPQVVLPTQGFGMPYNANNPFMVPTPNFGIPVTPVIKPDGSGGLFSAGHQSAVSRPFTESGLSFGETPSQMSGLNFSAGQNSNNAFIFPQQSGVRNLTGTSVPQFQVGSSSAPGQTRRIRKAVRRTQR